MTLNALVVTSQAALSVLFLVYYMVFTPWWKTFSGRLLAGFVTCLTMIAVTLAVTGVNEGLGNSPIPVTIGRIGFSVILLWGFIELQLQNKNWR